MTKTLHLDVQQGTSWSLAHTARGSDGSARDLTGYSARMAIKRALGAGEIAYLSTGSDSRGGTLAIDGATGVITMSMTAAQTRVLESYIDFRRPNPQRYEIFFYDLELISGDTVERELEGRVRLSREITS